MPLLVPTTAFTFTVWTFVSLGVSSVHSVVEAHSTSRGEAFSEHEAGGPFARGVAAAGDRQERSPALGPLDGLIEEIVGLPYLKLIAAHRGARAELVDDGDFGACR